MTDRSAMVREVFHQAMERAGAERQAYVVSACGADGALREEVEALLQSLDRADAEAFIAKPIAHELVAEAGADAGADAPDGGRDDAVASAPGSDRVLGGVGVGGSVGRDERYEVLEVLGRGGMGVVLEAWDRRLGRPVALKFLFDADTDVETRERFAREARSACSISHPRVRTVYEVDEHQGQPFMVMELLEGVSLAHRLAEGRLALDDQIALGIQIAEGLEAIHAAGMVHRDLKPANVFLTASGVKILDFGLAKVAATSGATIDAFQTQTGALMGTTAYMSPEQARGEEIDFRSDVFSFGAVLYEMAAGRPAFLRGTTALTFDALLNRDPPPPSEIDPAADPRLVAVIARALAKRRDARYPSVAAVHADLEGLFHPHARAHFGDARRRRVLGWAMGALGLVALGTGVAIHRARPAPAVGSVAVLPFTSAAGDPGGEALGAGIAASIAASLSPLPGLRVVADHRGPRRQTDDLPAVGRELGVDAIVIGQVRQRGEDLDIETKAVAAATGSVLWSERYRRPATDIFAMQDDLARALAERLRPDLPTDQRRPARRPTAIPEAYRLYLRGRQEWEKRTDEAIRRAIAFYEAAIAADPSYALPHAGLADAYLAFRQQPPLETRPRAKAEAEKALALDPTLAEAHTSLAMLRFVFDWDWPEAEAGFRRSLALDPQHPTTHHWLGLYLMAMGRFDEAQAELERARTLDPFSLVVQANLARNDFFAGRDETAAARLEAALRSDHQFFLALGLLSHVRARQGRFADALAAAEQATASDDAPDSPAWLGYAAARAGRRAEARRLAAELADHSRRAPVDAYRVALVHVALGENDAAFEWLDRAYARRSPWLAYVLPDPAVDPLRRDPRFRELLGHLRLPM